MNKHPRSSIHADVYESKDRIEKRIDINETILWIIEFAAYSRINKINKEIDYVLPECDSIVFEEEKVIFRMPHYGTTLSQCLKDIRQENVKDIFIQLLKSVHYLHKQFIIHRDIKTDNIIIKDGKCKLIDYSIAYIGFFRDLLPASYTVSTWPYRAPEVYKYKPYDELIDEWSLGVVLYKLVSGHSLYVDLNVLFNGNNKYESLEDEQREQIYKDILVKIEQKQLDEVVGKNAKCSNDLINCLRRLLVINPKQRGSCEEILKTLGCEVKIIKIEPLQVPGKREIPSYIPNIKSATKQLFVKCLLEFINESNWKLYMVCFSVMQIELIDDDWLFGMEYWQEHYKSWDSDEEYYKLFPIILKKILNCQIKLYKNNEEITM